LVDVETALNQIAAVTIANLALQIREKQLPLLKLGEWQAQITLPTILGVLHDHDVAAFVLSNPGVRDQASELKLPGHAGSGWI
jgi:hypothetical protein